MSFVENEAGSQSPKRCMERKEGENRAYGFIPVKHLENLPLKSCGLCSAIVLISVAFLGQQTERQFVMV